MKFHTPDEKRIFELSNLGSNRQQGEQQDRKPFQTLFKHTKSTPHAQMRNG